MINRYSSRKIFDNKEQEYEDIFRDRNVKFVTQYSTPNFYRLSPVEYSYIETTKHIWSLGDKYFKLSNIYYGDPRDWWIIAKFNNKPTESHVKLGDIIYIPTRLDQVKALFKM